MPLQLPITNFVTITVTQPGAGLLPYAVNNLAIFTKETPVGSLTEGYGVYINSASVKADWGSDSEVYAQALAIFSQAPNILTGGGNLLIVPFAETSGDPQTLAEIMAYADETLGIFYGGALVAGYTPDDEELIDAVTYGQANRKLVYVARNDSSALTADTGIFAVITEAQQSQGRLLYYTAGASESREFAAAYASRLQSVDYTGSNTALNMHAKTLTGISPDTGITQTVLSELATLGADCYPSFGGGGQTLGKVYCSVANSPSDLVQNTNWLANALQVAGFNALAQTSTKIPQTEQGMGALKGAYTRVLQQGVANGFLAPGEWNSPDTFGDPDTLKRNILQAGFYVYSLPVVLQNQADRAARRAPLIQIAGKSAGAIDSSNVLVEIEA
jgi:Protein of unknown function (DUF3383)